MVTKDDIIKKAKEIGFEDIGFTTADSFDSHKELLLSLTDEYDWAASKGLDLCKGTDPKAILPNAKTIIVVLDLYFKKAYPLSMENHFGRCYLDDDRVTKDRLALRIKRLRSYLRDNKIDSKVPFNLPHRVAAARAGMGTFGKNCLFYSNKIAGQGSWVLPIAIVIDHSYEPDEPTIEMGCPDWCKNACVAACPTRALKGNSRIDPKKCISYLTYFGEELTPVNIREQMGLYVYGCDRCQNVCPRNQPWMTKKLPMNDKVAAMTEDFDLPKLLHMDKQHFKTRVWPHMFYMGYEDVWRWKMNVARVMGNSLDEIYVPDLTRAFMENDDFRIKSMCAWALGRIKGASAKTSLKKFLTPRENSKTNTPGINDDTVKQEILSALDRF